MTTVVRDEAISIERLELGPFGTNAYIVCCRRMQKSALVDAPAEASVIIDRLRNTTPEYILLTHGHMDHIGALAQLRTTLKVPLAAHVSDAGGLAPPPDVLLSDGDTIRVGELQFTVLHTPGHTPGSLCFTSGRYLMSGDTIFPGGPGRTSSPDDFRDIVESITRKILVLPDDTQIYPGHGGSTLLGKEKEEVAVFESRVHAPGLHGDILWLES